MLPEGTGAVTTGGISNSVFLAAFAVLAGQVSNMLGAVISKSFFHEIGPESIIALRVGFSALVLALLTRVWRFRVARDQFANLAGYGVMIGVMSHVAYQAYARIPVGVALAIEVTGPLAVVIFNSRRWSDFAWVALSASGLGLLLLRGQGIPAVNPWGIAFAFGSAACWAGYIVYGKRVSRLGGGPVVAVGMIIGAVVAIPPGAISAGGRLLDPHWLAIGFVIAILSSAIPFFLQMVALRRLPSRVFGVLASGVPAVGAVMGYLVIGETLEARQWLGILLVVAAGAGCTLNSAVVDRRSTGS